MKSVLMSIQPRKCHNITIGRQTIIVNKTKPKLTTPFKCYIYCTVKDYDKVFCIDEFMHKVFLDGEGKQKVIGELICDRIDEYECEFVHNYCLETVHLINRANCEDEDYPQRTLIWSNEDDNYNFSSDDEIIKGSCVSYKELKQYMGYGFNTFYGWHISNLKIYDKPKELSEFKRPCNKSHDCCVCDRYDYMGHKCFDEITRPPQSWCYVEEL